MGVLTSRGTKMPTIDDLIILETYVQQGFHIWATMWQNVHFLAILFIFFGGGGGRSMLCLKFIRNT